MTKDLPAKFTDAHQTAARPVVVRPAPGGLEIRGSDGLLIAFWRHQDLLRDPKGVFRCQADRGARLILDDVDHGRFVAPLKTGMNRKPRTVGSSLVTLLMLLTLAGIGVLLLPLAAGAIADRLPPQAERRLGDMLVSGMERRFGTCVGPAGDAVLQMLAARLGAALPAEARPRRIMVMRQPIPAAIAMPGGTIVVSKGLLNQAQSSDEVAGLLARALSQSAGRLPTAALFRTAPIAAFKALAGGTADGLDGETLSSAYSRAEEMDAERGAARLLATAGLAAQGSVRLPALDAEQWAALKSICG